MDILKTENVNIHLTAKQNRKLQKSLKFCFFVLCNHQVSNAFSKLNTLRARDKEEVEEGRTGSNQR